MSCFIYWSLVISLIVFGVAELLLVKFRPEKYYGFVPGFSMVLSILTILFLAITRDAYAIVVAFLLLITKGMLLLKFDNYNL